MGYHAVHSGKYELGFSVLKGHGLLWLTKIALKVMENPA